jgi:hypothetical protein
MQRRRKKEKGERKSRNEGRKIVCLCGTELDSGTK